MNFADNKCLDCGTEDATDRDILWTTDAGAPQWVCPRCKAARDEKDAQEEKRQADLIAFALNMY